MSHHAGRFSGPPSPTASVPNLLADPCPPSAGLAGRSILPAVVILPAKRWRLPELGELWAYRELFSFLVWREIKVRYQQTAIGVAWVALQPIVTMLVFSFFFGRVMRVPSDGVPYPLFAYAGLLCWLFFSKVVTQSTASIVASANLVTKVYFPRLLIPAAVVGAGLVDFAIGFAIFVPCMLLYHVPVQSSLLLAVVPAAVMVTLALGTGLWVSSVNVRYRDVGAVVPLALQIWMFATPIIYPSSLVPLPWRSWLALNPLTGVTEAFRAALFGRPVDWVLLATSLAVSLGVLLSGALAFRHCETTFADVV